MKIGLFLPLANPLATPEYIARFAQEAEQRGFHQIWVAEHVVLFDEYESRYPYSADGRIPGGGPEGGLLDPLVAFGAMAALTSEIRLGTGILLVPQRNPVYTAKEVATVDWLSNGRFTLGIGVGWLEEEFRALGVPFAHRGSRTREYIEVMKRLWCDPVSEYQGRFYELPPCRQYPKPVQQPHPPLVFGGESDAALRRVADLGNGWFGFDHTPESAAEHVKRLDAILAERGRDRARDGIEVIASPYLRRCDGDAIKRYADAGVDQVVLVALAPGIDAIPATLDPLEREHLAAARTL